jgi:protein ImuA
MDMSPSRQTRLASLRAEIFALEKGAAATAEVLPFGDPRVDGCLPGGGLALGRWHEVGGEGLELENATCAAAFVARLAAPLAGRGELIWVFRRDDLFAPGLAGLGFPAQQLICVCVRDEAEGLAVLEDALRTAGVAAAIGEVDTVSLTAGRRLQLACERQGAVGFVLRRRSFGAGRKGVEPAGSAAATRWRIGPSPSEPAPGEPGLGPPRWETHLERCRGGRTGGWILEASEDADATHPFRVVAELGDRDVAAQARFRLAG